jgi:hypothetical protein
VSAELIPESWTIQGACHCGNIRFELRWPESETEIPVRRCGCSFCQKHGGAWTSHRNADLKVDIADKSLVSKYRFGTETADFLVCSVCGVLPVALSEIDFGLYAVVNVNTFEDTGTLSFSSSKTDFDGEKVDKRLERRKRNWIPNVLLIN